MNCKLPEARGTDVRKPGWFVETANAGRSGLIIEKQIEPVRIAAVLVALRAATVKDREQTLYWVERSAEEGDPTLF